MQAITDHTLDQFLGNLASSAPTPGGGSAAAVIGAMGAALISMVCNVTIGKKGCEAAAAQLQPVVAASERLRADLTSMIALDISAFDGLMAAYRQPKNTDEEKLRRAAAIQHSLRAATEAPLACARACVEVIRLARGAAELGYSGVISDAGVGVLAAQTALRSAALNVEINAPLLKDRSYADEAIAELARLLEFSERESESVFELVRSKLG